MVANYRVMVHYRLKKGMEEKGIRFLETELISKGLSLGCHYIELWQNERDPSIVEGIAVWNNIDEARGFQTKWENKEKEFITQFCAEVPKREFYKIRQCYTEKARKVA